MKPLKQSVSITLDEQVLQSIRDLADSMDLSLSAYINRVLRCHLRRLERGEEENLFNPQ